MKNILGAIASCLLLGCSSQQESLVVEIEGWGDDTILVLSYDWSGTGEWCDTLVADKGRVSFSHAADTVEILMSALSNTVSRGAGRVPLFLEAPTISTLIVNDSKEAIKGQLSEGKLTYTSKGTHPIMAERARMHNQKVEVLARMDSNERLLEANPTEEYFAIRRNYLDTLRHIERDFIFDHPTAQLSGRLLLSARVENFYELYEVVSEEVKMGFYGRHILEMKQHVDDYFTMLEQKQRIKVGNTAPAFTLMSIAGEEVSLADFRGKWVLVDFWGSWCGPCIASFPKLKEVYNRHRAEMEVVAIGCRDTEETWRQAVAEHELPWTNLLSNGKVQLDYAVQAYPTKVLIDPQGVIRLTDHENNVDFYGDLDELF